MVEDMPRLRFGTVRPRVQIPGPRPKLELRFVKPAALKVKSRLSSVVVRICASDTSG